MYFTGIDLHKKTSYLTTIDSTGKIVAKGNLPNDEKLILRYFFDLDDDTKIVIESMSSWYWLYDLLAGTGFDVTISNPAQTKAIASAKIKNDKLDSHMLAQLLRSDLIAFIHVCRLETRELKELLRHRTKLVRDAARMKNRIHNLLMKNNYHSPCSDLFGVTGLQFLKEVSLPDYQRASVETYLVLYEQLVNQINPLTKRIKNQAKINQMAALLMTIPGVGPIISMHIVAEIEDISRFPSYRHLASYAGLVPSLDASGGKERRGRITKQGSPHLRTALVEAAHSVARMKNNRLNTFFRRRIVKSGYQRAIVATAHKISQYAFFILKNRTPYQEEYPVNAQPVT